MNTTDYWSNLEKWQASSHPVLANSRPEELFEAGFLERYRCLHNDLWRRIIRVHGTLHTLEQLKEFPFEYIYARGEMEFWRLVIVNFLDIACLRLHGLVGDKGEDVHTIPSFRDDIIKAPWLCCEKLDLLKQTLRERKFDAAVRSIEERVKGIRDNCIAHQLFDKQTASPKEPLAVVSLEQLRQLFQATHSFFGALSFGSAYATLAGDLMPGMVGGRPVPTCLDDVLDAVLRDSDFVNQPERRAEWWPGNCECMPVEQLEVMNKLRKRIGLREA